MKITDYIRGWLSSRDNHTLRYSGGYCYIPSFEKKQFGETMFLNIAQILTDIYAELTWYGVDTPKFKAWKSFMQYNGQRILLQLLRGKGYTVIGYSSREVNGVWQWIFYELGENEYTVVNTDDRLAIRCRDAAQKFYVLKSPTYEQTGSSDHQLCKGYISMLDAVLNGATTTAERLGAYIVMSPKADNFGGVLDENDKKEFEKEMAKEYGMLKGQKQVMLLNRPMDTEVISLAAVDYKMNDKAKLAILAIADRLKVPANQIAIIDSNSSKSLSNGSELREGDLAKYRSFRRLIDATFYNMAIELGMQANYFLENEPKTIQGQSIENAQQYGQDKQ